MSSERNETPTAPSVQFPRMLEPALESFAGHWSAEKRRNIVRIWQRWVGQLLCSADLMDRVAPGVEPAVGIPHEAQADAELLESAAQMEYHAARIRAYLGYDSKPPQAERLQLTDPN